MKKTHCFQNDSILLCFLKKMFTIVITVSNVAQNGANNLK